jgi:hypothetical protein
MLYDVKRISFCPSRYWPTVAVASSRGGALEHRASLVRAEFYRPLRVYTVAARAFISLTAFEQARGGALGAGGGRVGFAGGGLF